MTRTYAFGLVAALQVTLSVLGADPTRPAFALPPAMPTLAPIERPLREPQQDDQPKSFDHEEPARVPASRRQPGIL